MKKKTKSFADFAQTKDYQTNEIISEGEDKDKKEEIKTLGKARPGKASLPTVTFRVNQEQWERLKFLAIQERTTIQNLAEQAFSADFKKRGLP